MAFATYFGGVYLLRSFQRWEGDEDGPTWLGFLVTGSHRRVRTVPSTELREPVVSMPREPFKW